MKEGAEAGCFKCLNVLASQLINGFIFKDRKFSSYIDSFKSFMQASVLGDFWGFDYAFFIFSHIFRKDQVNFKEVFLENEKMIFDFSERIHISFKSFNQIHPDFSEHGGQYYLLGYCLLKGIGCKINIKRSIDVMITGLSDPAITNPRVLYRYLWKAYTAAEDKENAQKYLGLYLAMVNKLERKFPQHTYFLAKYYLNGTGVEKDIMKAHEYAEQGANFREDYMFFCPIYYKERSAVLLKNILEQHSDTISKIIKEKTMCQICKEKPKFTMFFPCKHRVCCMECGNKIFGENNNCFVCDTMIEFVVNSNEI
jgi:hypothetical protein